MFVSEEEKGTNRHILQFHNNATYVRCFYRKYNDNTDMYFNFTIMLLTSVVFIEYNDSNYLYYKYVNVIYYLNCTAAYYYYTTTTSTTTNCI